MEYGMFAKEVALHLDINKNTLRRWCLELEKWGYEFARNEKEQRIFFNRDIVALQDFKRLIDKTQSLENAAKAVVAKTKEQENVEKTLSVIRQEDDKITFTKAELEEYTQKIIEQTAQKTAQEILDKFNREIEKRDRQLVQSLNQALEQRRLELAAAQEKSVSFWSRLFGKRNVSSRIN